MHAHESYIHAKTKYFSVRLLNFTRRKPRRRKQDDFINGDPYNEWVHCDNLKDTLKIRNT